MLDILLTVPHGAQGNDVLGPLVGEALYARLVETGASAKLLVSRADRLNIADMNRAEGRGSDFRRAVAEALLAERPSILIDVHSFPHYYEAWENADIVLLETPGLTDRTFLDTYVGALNTAAESLGLAVGPGKDFFACVRPAQCQDDILIHAKELGQPAGSFMLAEHNESGDPAIYAALHARALKGWIAALRESIASSEKWDDETKDRLAKAGYMEARVPFKCGNCKYAGEGVIDGRFLDPLACGNKEVRATVERDQACCNHFEPRIDGDQLVEGGRA